MKKCLYCKKKLKKGRRKYCSDNCQKKDRYQNNKEKYIENNEKWRKNNPEKYKEIHLKSNKKFRENHRERFNQLMRNQYHKHKPKWKSRQWTYQIINDSVRKKPDIKNECRDCRKTKNLSLKFEVYPNTAKEIRQALKDRKIYYLCKGCRFK